MSELNIDEIAESLRKAIFGLSREVGRRVADRIGAKYPGKVNMGSAGPIDEFIVYTVQNATMSVLVDYFLGKFDPMSKENQP